MSEITLRPATKADAADLAILDNIASHGMSLWYWQGVVKNGEAVDAMALGRSRLGSNVFYGWKNATIVQEAGITLGMSCSYMMQPPDDEGNIKALGPFMPIFELLTEVVGHYYIDTLAVYPQAQGKGAGRMLFDHGIAKGRENGCAKVSLIAEDANENALALYKSCGFETRDSRPFVEFDGPCKTKQWLLMTRELT